MTFAFLKVLAIGVVTATASTFPLPADSYRVPTALGCLQFTDVDSQLALHDAKSLVSDARFARARVNPGFPNVIADSVSFYPNSAACDTAANRYRLARMTEGSSGVLWPVLLIRLGPSKFFVATSLQLGSRDYVLFDSLMQYKGVFFIN